MTTGRKTPPADGKCGAKTANGKPCQRRPRKGGIRCRQHGGNSPQALAAADDRLRDLAAARELAKLGYIRTIHPAEALIELVSFQAGLVDYWRARVAELAEANEKALTWNKTSKVQRTGTEFGTDTTWEAKPHVAYAMLERANDQLADYSSRALKAGVEERKVQIAQRQGATFAALQVAILDRLFAQVVKALTQLGVDDVRVVDGLQVAWSDAVAVIIPDEVAKIGPGENS